MAITDLLPPPAQREPAESAESAEPIATCAIGASGVCGLQDRALALRSAATALDPILAVSYRRRACELELELWIHEVRSGATTDEPPTAA